MIPRDIVKIVVFGLGIVFLLIVVYLVFTKFVQGEGGLLVETNPSGARVVIDDKDYKTPATIGQLTPGQHKITTMKEGFKERTDIVEVKKDTTTKVKLWLYSSELSPSIFKSSIAEEQKTLTDFEKLIQYLPYSNLHLNIEYLVVAKEPSIKITLYARLNRADQIESYKQQLTDYGQEALDWIKSKGVNTEKLNIIWAPKNPFKS